MSLPPMHDYDKAEADFAFNTIVTWAKENGVSPGSLIMACLLVAGQTIGKNQQVPSEAEFYAKGAGLVLVEQAVNTAKARLQ